MPCRDYEGPDSWDSSRSDENRKLREQNDRLARIACKAMTALEENEIEDFLLLKDDEVREWWQKHKEADRKEQARLAEIERRERVKSEALARLSDEEKELLGLATVKKSKKSKRSGLSDVHIDDMVGTLEDIYDGNPDLTPQQMLDLLEKIEKIQRKI
jgi:HD superfamily phosphohydrolase